LELPKFTPLALDLKAHRLDFGPNVLDVRHDAPCENGSLKEKRA
jgi:hypothetical protein